MSMSPLFVAICPAGAVTGGPEALHQLVNVANEVHPRSAAICYMPDGKSHNVPAPYAKYNTPIVSMAEIPTESIVVIPELWPYMVRSFSQPCALWWLSVDNFVCGEPAVIDEYAYHLAQSAYARHHISAVLGKNAIMVTDYIDESPVLVDIQQKHKRVAVNPAKGAHLIDEFCEMNPDIDVIRLEGMNKAQLLNELSHSLMYIDFGHHPGKDRLPREAALAGCIVAVNELGAASFDEDVPVDKQYKFTTIAEASNIARDVLSNYAHHLNNQRSYQYIVSQQKIIFSNEVRAFIAEIINNRGRLTP